MPPTTPHSSALSIRRAGLCDSVDVARIYTATFPALFGAAFGLRASAAARLLHALHKSGVLSIDRYMVAERGNVVAGFAAFVVDRAEPPPDALSFWRVAADELNPLQALRAFAGSVAVSLAFAGRAPDQAIAYLDTLAVDEEFRGQGIGTALLEHCAAEAADHGFRKLALHVLLSNEAARRLYERCGFSVFPDERILPRLLSPILPASRADLMIRDLF